MLKNTRIAQIITIKTARSCIIIIICCAPWSVGARTVDRWSVDGWTVGEWFVDSLQVVSVFGSL